MSRPLMSRKAFLRWTAAAAAAGLLPRPARADDIVDVAIIGAGLAGLTTARRLHQAGVESVVVLEARPRVGGRTLNLPLPGGHVVEGGGEWIGPGQDRIAALAEELGVGTFSAFYDGDTTYDIGGVVSRGFLPDLDLAQGGDFVRAAYALDRAAAALPKGHPWRAPDAAQLDALTLGDWLREHTRSAFTRDVFLLITRALMAGYPDRISLLWFLNYLSSAGGLLPLILNDGGAQDLRLRGGSQILSQRMARDLGDRLRLSTPVLEITDTPGRPVAVRTTRGQVLAQRVVVAMMPADVGRIDFDPPLPPQRLALNNGWAQLTRLPIVKASAVYDTPFWRADGLNGAMQSDRSPLQLVFDNSPEDGSVGILTSFLSVAETPEFGGLEARQRGVCRELGRYFGERALDPVNYVEKDWATDPWSTGCITPLPPGLLSTVGHTLRPAIGRVHWAGTETATAWCGFMDGAVRSGERVAATLLGG